MHKGLGILLDVFKTKQQHLFIMTVLDKEFEAFYSSELYNLPNIHYIGAVGMRSRDFFEIANQCAFSILPSCSEAQAGSAIETMAHGLIQIVTVGVGLDVQKYGYLLPNDSPKTISTTIDDVSSESTEKLRSLSRSTIEAAEEFYSPDCFLISLKNSIEKIAFEYARKAKIY